MFITVASVVSKRNGVCDYAKRMEQCTPWFRAAIAISNRQTATQNLHESFIESIAIAEAVVAPPGRDARVHDLVAVDPVLLGHGGDHRVLLVRRLEGARFGETTFPTNRWPLKIMMLCTALLE